MSRTKLLIALFASSISTSLLAAPSYVASLAAPASTGRVVSSERLWTCEGATCLAGGAATSPAKHICSRLARDVGALAAFSAKGRAFNAEELAQCNARAGHIQLPAAAN